MSDDYINGNDKASGSVMKTILIIDDSFIARMMIKKVLSQEAYNTCEASDGSEAFIILQEKRVDLILLDLLMPKESGEVVLERLKAHYADIPVIILSADIQETTKQRCISGGAATFVTKPPNPLTLLPVIKEILS